MAEWVPLGWPPSTCQAKPKHTDQSPGTVPPPSARVGDATEDAYVHAASLSSGGRRLQLLSGAHPAETWETFATNFYSNGSASLTTYLKHHMQRSLGKTFPFPHAAHSPSSHLTPNGRSLEIPDKLSEVILHDLLNTERLRESKRVRVQRHSWRCTTTFL